MAAILCLCTCALATAQAPATGEWLLSPNVGRGQELVYRGTFVEESLGRAVQFNRTYRVETRVFVLDGAVKGPDNSSKWLDVAFFTLYKLRPSRPDGARRPSRSSAPSARTACTRGCTRSASRSPAAIAAT